MAHLSVRFHYLLSVDCLPPEDAGVARRLFEDVEALPGVDRFGPPVQVKVDCPAALLTTLREAERVFQESGRIPLIHLDAHATGARGIEFQRPDSAASTWLPWPVFAAALGQLNRCVSNQLMVVLCACESFLMGREIALRSPAPWSVAVAPALAVTVEELESTVRDFYRNLIVEQSFVKAMVALEGVLSMWSSEDFLQEVLVRRAQLHQGVEGRRYREHQLSRMRSTPLGREVPVKTLRRRIRNEARLTDRDIVDRYSVYLCGRPPPFSAADVHAEARRRPRQPVYRALSFDKESNDQVLLKPGPSLHDTGASSLPRVRRRSGRGKPSPALGREDGEGGCP